MSIFFNSVGQKNRKNNSIYVVRGVCWFCAGWGLSRTSIEHTTSACWMATVQCSRKRKLPPNCAAGTASYARGSSLHNSGGIMYSDGPFHRFFFQGAFSSMYEEMLCKLPCSALVLLQARTAGSSLSSQWKQCLFYSQNPSICKPFIRGNTLSPFQMTFSSLTQAIFQTPLELLFSLVERSICHLFQQLQWKLQEIYSEIKFLVGVL